MAPDSPNWRGTCYGTASSGRRMLTLLNLLSALAMLVWGTHLVRTGVLRVYGADLRRVLSTSIKRRGMAFMAGVGVTSLVQSSNATSVIVCSFVAQGLIGLAPALAIMLGADVGTALMTGVLSFDLSWLSPLLIFCGVIVHLSSKKKKSGQIGRIAIGLGLITLALQLTAAATRPMTEMAGIEVLFSSLTGDLLLDALIGALFAMVTYSSLAAVLLAATLATSGVISLEVALCLVVGANLGSGILGIVGASNHNAAGRRVALGSLLFRLAGAAVVLPFIGLLQVELSQLITDPTKAVVAFHIAYNFVRSVLFLMMTERMARFLMKSLPDSAEPGAGIRPRYLDTAAINTPTLALANAAREVLRMGEIIENMLAGLLVVVRDNDAPRGREVRKLDDDVDKLYTDVKMYLARVSRQELDEAEIRRWTDIITLTINLEQSGDLIERIVTDVETKKIVPRRHFSDAGMSEVMEMHARLVTSLQLGLSVFLNGDVKSAQRLLEEKETFRDLERRYAQTHLLRLAGESMQTIETSSLHLDIISDMKRLHSLFCSPAYPVLDKAGLLRKSRLEPANPIAPAVIKTDPAAAREGSYHAPP
ncbi:MAG: phosphate:Na+ symporter [Burkholderiales bacterium]